MNLLSRAALLGFVALSTSGCASIVSGQNQPLSVETHHQGKLVEGAKCKLANDKGTWFLTTPGSATVRRAHQDLQVTCEKAKLPKAAVSVKSKAKAMLAGNILLGGVVGAGIDAGTGAAYDYPEVIRVEMGSSGIQAEQRV
jgi:hypothetical protein